MNKKIEPREFGPIKWMIEHAKYNAPVSGCPAYLEFAGKLPYRTQSEVFAFANRNFEHDGVYVYGCKDYYIDLCLRSDVVYLTYRDPSVK